MLVFSLAAACGKGKPEASAAATGSSATATAAAPATVPAGGPPGKPACPSTGPWAACTVLERLDRAGLAPRRDSGDVQVAPLTQSGMRVHLGSAVLEVFIYADVASRERDEARLDKREFIEPAAEPTLRGEPTLIRNANLLAILHSRSDHQRERVADAITAGLPQPHSGPARTRE